MAIVGGASSVLALGAAALACVATAAGATQRAIAPSGGIQGQPAHSEEGRSQAAAPMLVPLRVRDPAAYAREKQRAAELEGVNAPVPAAGTRGSLSVSRAPAGTFAAVFGSLNAAGLSAAAQIAMQGEAGDVTPPDTTGAIGPNHYVELVNNEVAAYDRTSLAPVGSPVDLSTFTGGVSVCDPQIKYDPQTTRWFYAAIRCDGSTTNNKLYIGFSKTSDPTDLSTAVGHGWCGYGYNDGKVLEDYPKLGLDSLHIVIGSNSFNAETEAFLTAHILSLPKPASGKIEACPAVPKLTTFGSNAVPLRTSVGSHLASTPEPATVADESPSGFVVAADEATFGAGKNIMIWQVAGTATVPELKPLGAPAVTSYSLPPGVPQPGSKDRLDSLDSRLTQAVAAADPGAGGAQAVWTQHTVAGGAGSVVRWYELLPAKLEVKQAGTISDATKFVFNGAIAPTLSGGAVIDYDTASKTALVQVMAQSRAASAPAGTMNTPVTLASSSAIDSDFSCPSQPLGKLTGATACRWGDYAGASVDPSNANVVWGSNQFNGPTGGATEFGHEAQWATQNFALTANEVELVAPTVTKLKPTKGPVIGGTAVTITGTSFGGATAVKFGLVNATSFTVNSETSIIATSPAETAGTVDVTVTTPGGTSAISSADRFKFVPTVTGLSPNAGPKAGGTSVTVTGTGFALGKSATIFKFGAAKATSVNCTSTTTCAAVAPAHEAGVVDVKATVNKVSSVKNAPADQFTYN
jgi:IPT/TIG domain